MKRRVAREQAFFLLFAYSFRDEDIEEVARLAQEGSGSSLNDFALSEARGAVRYLDELDAIISDCLKGWKLNRISKVSLTVLRLALYEIKYAPDIPVGISINEAVEIAKKFSGEKDGAFVNGVLSSAAKLIGASPDKAGDTGGMTDTASVPGEDMPEAFFDEDARIDETGAVQ